MTLPRRLASPRTASLARRRDPREPRLPRSREVLRRAALRLVLAVLVIAGFAPATVAQSGEVILASAPVLSEGAKGYSIDPALAADGSAVVFRSTSTNLHPSDPSSDSDIYVYDIEAAELSLASASASGVKADRESQRPSISGDGTLVAFESTARNLYPGANSFHWKIFVKDLVSGSVALASAAASGVAADNDCQFPILSADGTTVAFASAATNLDSSVVVLDWAYRVYVKDLLSGEVLLASASDAGDPANGECVPYSLSADGSRVAFRSRATNLHSGDTDNLNDVYVKDFVTGELILVSATQAGVKGNNHSDLASLSADGSRIAFRSSATNLSPADSDSLPDAFIKDLDTGALVLVSVTQSGVKGNQNVGEIQLSGNGNFLVFGSASTNYDPFVLHSPFDVYVKNLLTGDLALVSTDALGTNSNGMELRTRISHDGALVAFDSGSTNLSPLDVDSTFDVYVKRVEAPDADSDGVGDTLDNCPLVANSAQSDIDGDGLGDLCDSCPAYADANACIAGGSAAAEISASDGGVVATEDGALALEFDPGDLSGDTTVSVTQTPVEPGSVDLDLGTNSGLGQVLLAYDFEPDGITFDQPVLVTMTVDITDLGLNAEQETRLAIYVRAADGSFERLPESTCVIDDSSGRRIATCTGLLSHFSSYALVVPIDSDGDGVLDRFGDIEDVCPESPPAPSTLAYSGDMLVEVSTGGLANASLVASLAISCDEATCVPVVGGEVVFRLTRSDGTVALECAAPSDAAGDALCLVGGLAPDVYSIDASFAAVAGCFDASSAAALLVVYDPNVPHATGGGFIRPDAESTLPALTPQDKANFGFIVRIDKHGAAAGNLEFQYRAAGIELRSLEITWYTVSNNKAMFQGTATIGGAGLYTFRVTATDGDLAGGQPDRFDITIWSGTDTESPPAHRAKNDLAGGSIVVHRR